MLEGLFGNKNIERILLFLFVNHTCYGAQLQKVFKISLTPIQKALQKLEKQKILESYFEGKIKIYRFHADYPFIKELEALLKKVYFHLPSCEKKRYFFSNLDSKNLYSDLELFWEVLQKVDSLKFHAQSYTRAAGGWNARGSGHVSTIYDKGAETIIFEEKGSWLSEKKEPVGFTNTFRWTLDRRKKLISLEHLRFGNHQPVFLCYLTMTGPSTLTPVDSHLCNKDLYFGRILFTEKQITLYWRIIGPKKNEEINYQYLNKINI